MELPYHRSPDSPLFTTLNHASNTKIGAIYPQMINVPLTMNYHEFYWF
jgi:hypothetical protein